MFFFLGFTIGNCSLSNARFPPHTQVAILDLLLPLPVMLARVLRQRLWRGQFPRGPLDSMIKEHILFPQIFAEEMKSFIYICFFNVPLGLGAEVSEKEACALAQAFWDEVEPYLVKDSKPPSGTFFRLASRLARTGHENMLTSHLPQFGLSVDIPITFIDIGLREKHPVIAVSDYISRIDSLNKMDALLMGNRDQQYQSFWEKWKCLQPSDPVFVYHKERLGSCIPVAIHADEGTSVKKKALMVLQIQALMGQGSRRKKSDQMNAGLNLLGNSIKTRILFSVLLGRLYSGKKLGNRPLMALVDHLSMQLRALYDSGITVTIDDLKRRIYIVPLGLKGDWPALSKIGRLSRHHGRVTTTKEFGEGICHLCKAGMEGFESWHILSYENMSVMHRDVPPPWRKEPELVAKLALDPGCKGNFFKIDIFHTCHKGLMADIAANTIAPELS